MSNLVKKGDEEKMVSVSWKSILYCVYKVILYAHGDI